MSEYLPLLWLREELAGAIAKGVDNTDDLADHSQDYRNEMLEGADAVIELLLEKFNVETTATFAATHVTIALVEKGWH